MTTATATSVTIDFDKIVQLVKDGGVNAYVEQTGGGTATIYAGAPREEEGYGTRYAAIAGPGWFDGPGWTQGRGNSADFYIGADDYGDTTPVVLGEVVADVVGDTTDTAVVERIAARLLIGQATKTDVTVPYSRLGARRVARSAVVA